MTRGSRQWSRKWGSVLGWGLGRLLLEGGEDLFAVDLDVAGSLDAETDLIAADLKDSDDYVLANHDALVCVPSEHQHVSPSVEVRAEEAYLCHLRVS